MQSRPVIDREGSPRDLLVNCARAQGSRLGQAALTHRDVGRVIKRDTSTNVRIYRGESDERGDGQHGVYPPKHEVELLRISSGKFCSISESDALPKFKLHSLSARRPRPPKKV